jgi:hypothetical protein
MSVIVKVLVPPLQLQAAQTTQYTAGPGIRAIIDKATVTNTDTVARTLQRQSGDQRRLGRQCESGDRRPRCAAGGDLHVPGTGGPSAEFWGLHQHDCQCGHGFDAAGIWPGDHLMCNNCGAEFLASSGHIGG